MTDKSFVVEAMLLRWGDNNSSGRTVTFQLPELPGDHPFKGMPSGAKNGQRVGLSIALIDDDESIKPTQQYSLARRAGMLCSERPFQFFLNDEYPERALEARGIQQSDKAAAEIVRLICAIESRSELDTNEHAKGVFLKMLADFEVWKIE